MSLGFSVFNRIENANQLTLSNCRLYLDNGSLDKFIYFTDQVSLVPSKYSQQSQIEQVTKAAQKLIEHHGLKAIRPLKTLLMRMLENSWGFTDAHAAFIGHCKRLVVPFQALPIIEYPTFAKSMKKKLMVDFFIECCQILVSVREYKKAYEYLVRANRIPMMDTDQLLKIMPLYAVLSVYMKSQVPFDLKQSIVRNVSELFTDTLSRKQYNLPEIQLKSNFYMGLKEWRKTNQVEKGILRLDNLLDVFQDCKFRSLGSYIQDDLKGQNWRIKAQSVKDESLKSLQVIRSVNNPRQIYRYDSQNNIMYFNHRQCDQQALNNLITAALLMEREDANCQVEKRQPMDHMGGMGGMGGMGSLMGMMGSGRSRGSYGRDLLRDRQDDM